MQTVAEDLMAVGSLGVAMKPAQYFATVQPRPPCWQGADDQLTKGSDCQGTTLLGHTTSGTAVAMGSHAHTPC